MSVLLSGKSLHREIVLAGTGKTQTSFDVALFPRRPVVRKEEGPRQRKMIRLHIFPLPGNSHSGRKGESVVWTVTGKDTCKRDLLAASFRGAYSIAWEGTVDFPLNQQLDGVLPLV